MKKRILSGLFFVALYWLIFLTAVSKGLSCIISFNASSATSTCSLAAKIYTVYEFIRPITHPDVIYTISPKGLHPPLIIIWPTLISFFFGFFMAYILGKIIKLSSSQKNA